MSLLVKHTPGPWRADRRSILTGTGNSLRCLAEVFSGATESLSEANANEFLIAAAPDLYAAAIVALDKLQQLPGQVDAAVTALCSAIAKAEGRP